MPLKKKKKTKVKKKVTKKVTKKTRDRKKVAKKTRVRKKIVSEIANENSKELIIKTKPQWVKNSLATKTKYKDKYLKSIKNNDEFWRKEGKRITWIKPYNKIKDVKYSSKEVKIKWFQDGTLNASANCIDRQLEDKKGKTALTWAGDDLQDSQKITYKQLHEKVSKAANGLKKLGIKQGDRVTIY